MAASGGGGGGPGSSEREPGWEVAVRPLLSASYSAFEMRELPQLLASVIERWEGGGGGATTLPPPAGLEGGRSGGRGSEDGGPGGGRASLILHCPRLPPGLGSS